ncbi:hypothetical protein HAX54_026680 [Datura stramonium]|uniref:Uncharacterized protein n=1 Tax=Datura stramonium TaxID=4076 RepID=A0ABS8S825_DATST|nr:hypothetical protein [Datura stramonium]
MEWRKLSIKHPDSDRFKQIYLKPDRIIKKRGRFSGLRWLRVRGKERGREEIGRSVWVGGRLSVVGFLSRFRRREIGEKGGNKGGESVGSIWLLKKMKVRRWVVSSISEGEEKEDGRTGGAPVERRERMFSGLKWSKIMEGEEKKRRGKATK